MKKIVDGVEVNATATEVAEYQSRAAAFAEEQARLARLSYRRLRHTAYRDELGKEAGDDIRTIGDVLDTLIAELAAQGPAATAEFSAMLSKIAAVKTRFPKP